jgi:thioesterase domain-containing protein
VLDINGLLIDGALSLGWRYSPDVLGEATVERLIASFKARLDALTSHCAEVKSRANARAVAAIAAHLGVKSEDVPSSVLPLNALGSPVNLFCLHPGYGLVNEYGPIARQLDGVATVYGVQSPIFSQPSWRAASFEAAALDYVERIRRIQPHGPYCLLGWSLGGRLAVSMARHLEDQGQELAFVGLVDMGALLELEEVTAAEMARLEAQRPVYAAAAQGVFRTEVSELTTEHGLTADDEQWLTHAVMDTIVHFRQLLPHHRFRRIGADLHLWWAANAPKSAGDLDWQAHTSGRVETVATLDATHGTIIAHPLLAAQVRAIMAAQDRTHPSKAVTA